MKLILKYLKPFAFMAALSIGLLFLQNIADLWLPRYMSNIVDTGIMRGGVDEAAPRAMSGRAFDLISSCMSEDGKAVLAAAYSPVSGGNAPENLLSEFPDLSDGYFLTETELYTDGTLGDYYGKAAVTLSAKAGVNGIGKLSPEELYSIENINEGVGEFDPDTVPPQTRYELSTTLTRMLYRELGANMIGIQQRSIMKTGAMMLLITLLVMIMTVFNGFLTSKVSTGIGRKLRRDVFTKVQTFSPAEFDKFSTATLITRCTNDVQQVQMVAMMGLRMICSAPIMGVGGIIMALNTSRQLSWIIAIAVILLLTLQVIVFSNVIPKFKMMQKLLDKLNLVTRESLSGMMVIRAFGNETREEARFETANRDIRNTNRFVQRVMAIEQPVMQFIMGCTTLTVIFFGARAVSTSTLLIGEMMAFMQYVMQIIMSFLMIGMMFIMIPRALVSAARLSEVLSCETAINDKPKEQQKSIGGRAEGEIVFNNVSFQYQDAEMSVLSEISFTAKPGETTAFIGSTGSGKSTLINLIPRFYDVSSGSITLDGVDVRDLAIDELRSNLGYVPQKGILFSGDIGSNIRFGKDDADEEQLRAAIKTAQAEDFVYADKEGLSTEIAQSGDNVSGGQKQRLSIARALVKNPPVYIFDDSFSALDFKTDAALRKALKNHTGGATILVVAQRISTIMNAHQIIVLDAGRIVGKGTHAELLKTCEPYREIAESQLSKEELM